MTAVLPAHSPFAAAEEAWGRRVRPRRRLLGRLDQYWPLTVYFYLYPLWWVLGVSKLMIFILAVPMLMRLLAHRDVRVPVRFGAYVVFLVWVGLGVTMLWVEAPGTQERTGFGPLLGFTYRALWYSAITIACLYVLNADRTRLTAVRVGRMLAFMFMLTVAGGWLGLLFPNLDFPSVLELFLPASVTRQEFMNAMFHPRVALSTDFLGYEQPRVTAPYSYPNAWGNSFGVLLPFFMATWFGKAAGRRRYFGPAILALAVVPMVYSLNRGLWVGLAIAAVWVTARRLAMGDFRALAAALTAIGLLIGSLVVTPLGDVIATRVNTPHSNERRQDTATEVIVRTWEVSPVLGYGSTRQMVGNFASIAGGAIPGCHQCAAPPLGTQGFLWGLIFMTGFAGAALMLTFLLYQFAFNARRPTTLGLVCSTVLLSSVFYFLFYDSLDVPMLVTMMTVGLGARDHSLDPRSLEAGP